MICFLEKKIWFQLVRKGEVTTGGVVAGQKVTAQKQADDNVPTKSHV